MKLLFDQNLSHRLVGLLDDIYPGSNHVELLGLGKALDSDVWIYAKNEGFTIVTKDADFSDLFALRKHPPKIIRLHLGNCTTAEVELALRSRREIVREFHEDENLGILNIIRP